MDLDLKQNQKIIRPEMLALREMSLLHQAAQHVLSREEARFLMEALFHGDFSETEMAELLTALSKRGVTAPELAGFTEAMRAASVKVPLTEEERGQLVDTCGTGGDGSGTFNISTAVALIAASCGAKVAKHGNRSVTSKCGSADVLEELGIPVGLEPAAAAEAIRKHGFAFLLATKMHPAMKVVASVRRALSFRTIFNILGPMTNPAGAAAQVMGVYSPELVPLVAEALSLLGTRHAMVVHGAGGLDELSLAGESQIAEVRGREVALRTLHPEELGLATASLGSLEGGDASQNAAILTGIFAGEQGPRRDVVLLNAAAVLYVAGVAPSLQEGVAQAAGSIDSGKVKHLVELLQA
jgi:anthranilate phosphoribosyltransferase